MNRRDFMKGMTGCMLGTTFSPNLLARCLPQYQPLHPRVDTDSYRDELMVVVGVGPFGARTTRLLSQAVSGITCHEVLFHPECRNDAEMNSLFAAVRACDLLFVVSGFEDGYCEPFVRAIWETDSIRQERLTVLLIPDPVVGHPSSGIVASSLRACADAVLVISGASGAEQEAHWSGITQRSTPAEQSIRHTIASITNLFTLPDITAVFFDDVRSVLTCGQDGRVGFAAVSGAMSGQTATLLAMARLEHQGASLATTAGVLVVIQGSSTMTMDDMAEVDQTLHDTLQDDALIMRYLLVNESLGDKLSVTIIWRSL